MILFGRVFYKESRQFKNQKTHVATRETKIKTEKPKKKKILSSFSKNQTDHRKHTFAKKQDKKKTNLM